MEIQIGNYDEVVRELVCKRLDLDKRQNYEMSIQGLFQGLNICSHRYGWVKQDRGYRCAGGSHYICNKELWVEVVQRFSLILKS
jgi:hypothetical protein